MSKSEFNFEDITFGKRVNSLCLESYIKSISGYNTKLPTALSSNHQLPIFLDTNVLLRYYETSLKYRDKLLRFFSDRIEQIVLTNEVQKEFVRNREDTIERFISQSLSSFKKDYETKFVNGFTSYLNDIKTHLDDFPEIGESINDIQSKVSETYNNLNDKINNIKGELKGLKGKDEYLNLFLKAKMLSSLDDDNIKLLKEQFNHLGKQLDEAKKDRENKTASIFPGYLDKKRKGKNPYGDFIIFHEILKYIKENNTDAVLLTFDAKGDWIKENREAHSHYIQIVYEATGHHIFIIDAEEYFEQNLNTNFAPVTSIDELMRVPFNKLSTDQIHQFQIGDIMILIDQLLELFDLDKLVNTHFENGDIDTLYTHKITILYTNEVIDATLSIQCAFAMGFRKKKEYIFNIDGIDELLTSIFDKLFAIYQNKINEMKK